MLRKMEEKCIYYISVVNVIISIGIHLDERPFEVHVVSEVLPTFLWTHE